MLWDYQFIRNTCTTAHSCIYPNSQSRGSSAMHKLAQTQEVVTTLYNRGEQKSIWKHMETSRRMGYDSGRPNRVALLSAKSKNHGYCAHSIGTLWWKSKELVLFIVGKVLEDGVQINRSESLSNYLPNTVYLYLPRPALGCFR